jgi:hypothetical protein
MPVHQRLTETAIRSTVTVLADMPDRAVAAADIALTVTVPGGYQAVPCSKQHAAVLKSSDFFAKCY